MNTRAVEFRDISDRLGLSAAEIGKVLGRSTNMIRQYRAARGRVPTEEVMDRLRAHWRSQLRSRLERAVSDLREAGLVVEIGWGPIMQRAAAISLAIEAAVAEREVA